MIEARVGEQTGAAAYASVNRIPCEASLSMFGVTRRLLPWQWRSFQPRSSIMIRMMLVCLPDADAAERITFGGSATVAA